MEQLRAATEYMLVIGGGADEPDPKMQKHILEFLKPWTRAQVVKVGSSKELKGQRGGVKPPLKTI
jgi:hypothetical protein